MGKRLAGMLAFDIFGSLFMGISIVCFAVQANFAPGGVNGLAVLSNYLFSVPIGLATVLINIPIILLTFRKLGKEFFIFPLRGNMQESIFSLAYRKDYPLPRYGMEFVQIACMVIRNYSKFIYAK